MNINVDQMLQEGITAYQDGKLEEAEIFYHKVLEIEPMNLDANNNLAILYQKLNRLDEAEIFFRKAIEFKPDYVEAYNNLGVLLKVLGRLKEAEISYKKAIDLKPPGLAQAHNNLANLLLELNKINNAEKSYKRAIEINPDFFEAHNNLGAMLKGLGRLKEAETSFAKVIELKPDLAEAYSNQGCLMQELGKFNEAKINYKKAIEIKPDYPEVKHLLAALTGHTTNSSPREFVENLFNNYARSFEHSLLNKLEYNTPNLITEFIVAKNPNIQLGSVLDLGCGTGLIGDKIKKYCSNLEGIDLSKSMLEKASAKNIYDKLEHKDIVEYLSTEDLDFNYFISADVFVYIGNLSEIFRLIKSRNKSKGKFIFSTEHTDRDGFFLEKSGRYSHSKKYIESLCEEFNYKLTHFETTDLRKDKDKFIIGGLYFLNF